MRLDTITRIERFMQDALLASPQVPLGVNVLRLAATEEDEGIVKMGRTIVVRYVGSNLSVQSTEPLVTLRTMQFNVTLSAQSYLGDSGHDYVVQMCAATFNTLTNAIPSDTGVEVFQPFYMSNETFEGLTDESIYVYTQTWDVVVQDLYKVLAMDPCVRRGNCSFLFPENTVSTMGPAEVLFGNEIYSPVLPPPEIDYVYNPRFCGVEVSTTAPKNLVYKFQPKETFIQNWEDYNYTSTGQFTAGEEFLLVNITHKTTGNVFRSNVMYSNCTGRRLIDIAGGLYIDAVGDAGNCNSQLDSIFARVQQSDMGLGYMCCSGNQTTVYADPSNASAPTGKVRYGVLKYYNKGTELTVGGTTYVQISPVAGIGKGWIPKDQFCFVTNYDPREFCRNDAQLDEGGGVPEGQSWRNTGKIESCE